MARNQVARDPPDGGWGWLIVIGGVYCCTMWGGIARCYSAFYSPLMDEFDADYATVSWLNGMFQVAFGFFTFVSSFAMKKFTRRALSMISALVCGIACFLASFSQKLWQVQILMGLVAGISMGFMLNCIFTMANRYFLKNIHRANQVLCLGGSIGPLILCPSYQFLVNFYGWRGASQILAGLYLNMVATGALLRPIHLKSDPYNPTEKTATSESAPEVDEQAVSRIANDPSSEQRKGFGQRALTTCLRYDLDLFVDRLFYMYTFSWMGFAAAYYSAITYMLPYGENEIGLPRLQASTLLSAFAGGEIFSRLMYGIFFDRMPQRYRILYISVLFAGFGVAMLIFPFSRGYAGAMACSTLIGVLGGGADGVFAAFITEIFSVQKFGSVFGYMNVIAHSVGMLATVLTGAAIDNFGTLAVAFYIGSSTTAISSIVCFIMHKAVLRHHAILERLQQIET